MKKYKLYVRYALTGIITKEIKCEKRDDLYKEVGKIVLRSIEHIERIDYEEIGGGKE